MIEKLIIPLDYIILAVGCLIVIFCFWRGITASILGLLTWLGSIIITIYFYELRILRMFMFSATDSI